VSLETHFPNALDLLAFVPYFALNGVSPSVFRSVLQVFAALMVAACFPGFD
jgi:predicted membrane metal-binding protein